jgi:hypothetical protein
LDHWKCVATLKGDGQSQQLHPQAQVIQSVNNKGELGLKDLPLVSFHSQFCQKKKFRIIGESPLIMSLVFFLATQISVIVENKTSNDKESHLEEILKR